MFDAPPWVSMLQTLKRFRLKVPHEQYRRRKSAKVGVGVILPFFDEHAALEFMCLTSTNGGPQTT